MEKQKKKRQCIYMIDDFHRCENDADGYFFCKTHFDSISKRESCFVDEGDYSFVLPKQKRSEDKEKLNFALSVFEKEVADWNVITPYE